MCFHHQRTEDAWMWTGACDHRSVPRGVHTEWGVRDGLSTGRSRRECTQSGVSRTGCPGAGPEGVCAGGRGCQGRVPRSVHQSVLWWSLWCCSEGLLLPLHPLLRDHLGWSHPGQGDLQTWTGSLSEIVNGPFAGLQNSYHKCNSW